VCDRGTHAAGDPEPDAQCQRPLHAHQAYRAEGEEAEHRRGQHVSQKLHHWLPLSRLPEPFRCFRALLREGEADVGEFASVQPGEMPARSIPLAPGGDNRDG
jgi:hypothetical protein